MAAGRFIHRSIRADVTRTLAPGFGGERIRQKTDYFAGRYSTFHASEPVAASLAWIEVLAFPPFFYSAAAPRYLT
jgi:hypothetical protein